MSLLELLELNNKKKQTRSQDFCMGGRFAQNVDLFLLFFLSVREGV